MNRVVGGTGGQCPETAIYGFSTDPVNGNLVEGCYCQDGYVMENGVCTPVDAEGFRFNCTKPEYTCSCNNCTATMTDRKKSCTCL